MCYIHFVSRLFPYTAWTLPGPPTGVRAAGALFLTLFAHLRAARNPTSSWALSCALVKADRGCRHMPVCEPYELTHASFIDVHLTGPILR
ncbi:hypothetical protein F5888DRAFT_127491 [Russula emetica]|nr:hypothetical protein F5888DRAFT_127491 [Russula emetica]